MRPEIKTGLEKCRATESEVNEEKAERVEAVHMVTALQG
jgi:hypothetical protein